MMIYNTLTKRKEEFLPAEPGRVKIYVCGPTTYNLIHLGNARPLVFFDTVRRYFLYRGYQVTYVQNFTDIDDKIINKAREEQADPLFLAEKYIEEFYRDAGALNVRPADYHPRVSQHMDPIVQTIQLLVEKGYAYEVEGDVYFSVRKFPGYGKLSGRSLDELLAGARVEIDTRKKDPLDFALWKKARPGEPAWESPWGGGRPGWHIECSVMSVEYLGTDFDIHGGGADLIFPHHENEIAQSEAATGRAFARYWMHNGFITVNQEKMSKSLGNFFLVREILDKFSPDVARFFLLSTHYRSPLDFDDSKLDESRKALDRIKNTRQLTKEKIDYLKNAGADQQERMEHPFARRLGEIGKGFQEAMEDDFNTALALARVFDLCREINGLANQSNLAGIPGILDLLQQGQRLLEELAGDVLGVLSPDQQEIGGTGGEKLVESLVQLLIEIRQEARSKKDWATADGIRNRMKELGVVLEDTPDGVRWRWEGK
ncbi:MAG TPA: cysteine--tRNA ligase [Clostridia bacterium]|nr:cysteine--tRNA ligase [Clostridia bacterium]